VFHLDEYIGLPATHPASFRKILLERLVNKAGIAKFHPLDGDAHDLSEVVRQVGEAIASAAVDIAFVGGTCFKGCSARALHPDLLVIWMYSLFWHLKNLSCKPTTQGSNLHFKSFFAFFPQNAGCSTLRCSGEGTFLRVFWGNTP